MVPMLSFDRSSLETKAARVDGQLDADDPVWQADDVRPAGSINVTGRLSSAGDGKFYFAGHMDGVVEAECRRCLTAVAAPVSEDLHLLFADEGDEDTDESDVYMLDARSNTVDLREAIREQWLLAAPAYPLCREDCKGLCPRCGADLNLGPCNCPQETDRRWDALKAPRSDA
jgi:uncharacterized protein